ncbi:ribonuclease HI [Croceimicrobium sp.]|uniref:ribonuclease HI n=1 Tax=Croceimicrobium sp. TaxID=2828340 RepID=UPI003BAA0C1F
MLIHLYTDGAAKGNPGPGGYGIVLEAGPHRKELSGGFRRTTNNRMELLAVIVGLEALKKPGQQVRVVSDSKYVVDAINKGWLRSWIQKGFKGKKNIDLWKRLIPMLQKHQVQFQWVKGHNDHPQNERCDRLAVAASEGPGLAIDQGFEISEGL